MKQFVGSGNPNTSKLVTGLTLATVLSLTAQASYANYNVQITTPPVSPTNPTILPNTHPVNPLRPAPNSFSTFSPTPFRAPDPGVPIDTSKVQVQTMPGIIVPIQPTVPNAISQPLTQSSPSVFGAPIFGGTVPTDVAPNIRFFDIHRDSKDLLQDKLLPATKSSSASSFKSIAEHTDRKSSNESSATHSTNKNSGSAKRSVSHGKQ